MAKPRALGSDRDDLWDPIATATGIPIGIQSGRHRGPIGILSGSSGWDPAAVRLRSDWSPVGQVVTPRFIPTCSPTLLAGLGELAARRDPIGTLLGSCWDPVGILLGPYWDPVGILLGSY